MVKAWADDLWSKNPKSCEPFTGRAVAAICATSRVCLTVSKGKFGIRKEIRHVSSHVMAAAISSPHSLPLPWKDMETLSWGITCWRQKWHFWDTSHRGSWGVLILLRQGWWQLRESVFVHVRCHNARLWAEKLLVEKQPHPGVLLQERLWRQDLIFNYLRHQNGNHKYLQEDFFFKKHIRKILSIDLNPIVVQSIPSKAFCFKSRHLLLITYFSVLM